MEIKLNKLAKERAGDSPFFLTQLLTQIRLKTGENRRKERKHKLYKKPSSIRKIKADRTR